MTLSLQKQRKSAIRNEYLQLAATGFNVSLQTLFNSTGVRITDLCRQFYPHPDSASISARAKAFCEEHGIWLDGAQHYVTCELFLFPDADPDRLLTMVKNNCIDYWLNDTYGRDIFHRLSPGQQREGNALIARMAGVGADDLSHAGMPPGVEKANLIVLQEMKASAPDGWFRNFLHLYNYHLSLTHRHSNWDKGIGSVEGYIDDRCHTSGMYYINSLIEYGCGEFLDWFELESLALSPQIRRLHQSVARFGCLSNDFFSFEKESIDNEADANLLMAVAYNFPSWSFEEVISQAATMVQYDLRTAVTILEDLSRQVPALQQSKPQLAAALGDHLQGLFRCLQASWTWQVHTERYKRERSIWEETTKKTIPSM